jgi:prepilin-type N-terminal cleavage/methylation domain-containing protein
MKDKAGFTLIEIIVVVGVLTVLIVSVSGIMGMTFKAKNTSDGNELLSAKAVMVLTELKRNVLNADVNRINCPSGVGTSISFVARDNVETSLKCLTAQIASVSAKNGTFYLLDNGIITNNCSDFVRCNITDGRIKSVDFVLRLKTPANAVGAGTSGVYYGVAVPRE